MVKDGHLKGVVAVGEQLNALHVGGPQLVEVGLIPLMSVKGLLRK